GRTGRHRHRIARGLTVFGRTGIIPRFRATVRMRRSNSENRYVPTSLAERVYMSIRRVPVHCLLALNALVAGIAFAQDPATAPDAAAETAAVETVPAPAAAPEPLPLDPADSLLVGDAKAGEAKAAACGACHGADGNSA